MIQSVPRGGQILVLDENESELESTCISIREQLPGAAVTPASTVPEFREELKAGEFDLVVIDYDLTTGSGLELVHEVRLQDFDPAILIVSASNDPHTIAEISNAGCHRFLVKAAEWTGALGPAIRHSLRMRRLEEENRLLVSKLTEANKLLEEKNRRLDEFSATVAHDIRGLLGGLAMRLDYIIDVSKDSIDEKLHELLENAHGATERVAEIVHGTYDFARLGREALKKETVKLARVVQEVVNDMQFEDSLNIHIGLGDNLPELYANEALLRRVVINLITNAVKYADKEEIIINIGVERYYENSLAPYCSFFIEDNGKGIDEAELPHVFDMFWQERAGNGCPEQGIGIGLAVVRRIVELHTGSVKVQSNPGEGTRFLISMPLEEITIVG